MTVGLSPADLNGVCVQQDGWVELPIVVEAVFGERKNTVTFRTTVNGKVLGANLVYMTPYV